jgi:hypothetical protein
MQKTEEGRDESMEIYTEIPKSLHSRSLVSSEVEMNSLVNLVIAVKRSTHIRKCVEISSKIFDGVK